MHACWAALAAAALGFGPYSYGPAGNGPGTPAGYPAASIGEVTSSGLTGSYGEQLYPYEAQEPWLHGYFQEIPAYGGYHSFRPYNYKHVLSQSQTAAGFGMSPVMPYSQQFWHRYENRANLSPYANEPGTVVPMPAGPVGVPHAFPGLGMAVPAPGVEPAAWNAGPVIVPASGEQNPSTPATGKGRWGRWSEAAGR